MEKKAKENLEKLNSDRKALDKKIKENQEKFDAEQKKL